MGEESVVESSLEDMPAASGRQDDPFLMNMVMFRILVKAWMTHVADIAPVCRMKLNLKYV